VTGNLEIFNLKKQKVSAKLEATNHQWSSPRDFGLAPGKTKPADLIILFRFLFFFQEKKEKALFSFAKGRGHRGLGITSKEQISLINTPTRLILYWNKYIIHG
jgi:hypothetical protein